MPLPRSTRRTLVALPFAGAAAIAVSLLGPSSGPGDAPSPSSAVNVRSADRASTGIEALQQHLTAQPRDHSGWSTLGLAYVEAARATRDPTYYPKAEDALRQSLQLSSTGNDGALAGLAALEAARHDFSGALADADRALDVNPRNPAALAARTDSLTELGRYDEALAAAETADESRPGPTTFSRLSYQYELRGDHATAEALLVRAQRDLQDPAAASFLLVQSGELARKDGRLHDSRTALTQASRLAPDQPSVLAAQARLEVAKGHTRKAERIWAGLVRSAPLPEYLVEYGELLETLGRMGEARDQYVVADASVALAKANGVSVDLETAVFQADHGEPATALAVAETEWQRRQSVHAADALGWALHMSQRDREALRYALRANKLGTRDPRFLAHLGVIEAELGRKADARVHMTAALAADPGWSPWQQARVRAEAAALKAQR